MNVSAKELPRHVELMLPKGHRFSQLSNVYKRQDTSSVYSMLPDARNNIVSIVIGKYLYIYVFIIYYIIYLLYLMPLNIFIELIGPSDQIPYWSN